MAIPLHSRIALRSEVDNLYTHAFVGSEGWVRDFRTDEAGFEMVKVEWDKEHWRFNGQEDGWTFASHFDVVGPPEPSTKLMNDDDELPAQHGPSEHRPSDEELEAYIETITEAMNAASDSEGFLVVTVSRVQHPQTSQTVFIPHVFQQTLSQESGALLDMQIIEMASSIVQRLMTKKLEDMR